ncbi:hypothetical protein IPR86_22260, partial [Xanthomonas perforans]|nr:hypothetical protein [Xanthomonas perforans]
MNRIYRKVWNKSLGVWAVASELASGDSPGAVASAAFIDRRQSLALAAAIALALGGAGLATPLPANAQSVEVGRGGPGPRPHSPP